MPGFIANFIMVMGAKRARAVSWIAASLRSSQ
jgi:hypothetical protein